MPKQKLKHHAIAGLKAPKKNKTFYDTLEPGLILRLSKAGSKTFSYRYTFNGKKKRFTIGKFPGVSLADARRRAREIKVDVGKGIDPQAQKFKQKHQPDPKTFGELAHEFMDKHLPTLRETTRTNYKRIIEVELLPAFGNYPINDITKHQIISLLDKKAYKDDSPTMANRIRARLSRIFTFAMERDLAESNPVATTATYNKGKTRRSRFYNEEEMRELWDFFEQFSKPTEMVLKMLLITGQRKTETMKMRWDNIRGDVWTIPAEIAKNKQAHDVPLSDMAIGIIETMRPLTGESDYVFCSTKKQNAPMSWLTRARTTIQNHSNVSDFRPHDLRRTVATYMAKLGVDRTVLGKILNHKGLAGDSQVTAIYDRHSYNREKRQAMNRWAARLQQIIDETETKIHEIG